MKRTIIFYSILLTVLAGSAWAEAPKPWVVDSGEEWTQAKKAGEGLTFDKGMASPAGEAAHYRSVTKTFDEKRSAQSLVLKQSDLWQNWEPIKNLGPKNLQDAPVLLTIGPDNYWMFGRFGGAKKKAFKAKPATLEGFDIPLTTTPFPNQFNAPGGLKQNLGGYNAWQSRDMVNWVHHGPVSEGFSRWVTSAEYVDGKAYIYYDYPNDQDPHVYVDGDLSDGVPGKNMGMAFKDPSHGSDSGFIRDKKGDFHVFYEDWSPINASKRSWDSPLAGHAVSKDGLKDYKILKPAIDNRTKPTGEVAEYRHPHWKQHKDWDSAMGKYNVHSPEQEAYGDWAAICVGDQYYLFGDFDPVGGHAMAVGWFTSSSLDQPFTWCDKIGKGHPDPDVCFAEGKFYLATQQPTDYVSVGPWVPTVEARAGVDTDKDGKIDQWTEWREVKETYDYVKGFSKQVKRNPASLDLSALPAGFGFSFDVRIKDATTNKSKPMLDRVTLCLASP